MSDSDSDNDINDDRSQEMGQVMAASSGRIDKLAGATDFRFDLQKTFKKLTIAANNPSDGNLEALQSTFRNLDQLSQILLSKKHTAEEAAIIVAAGMRSTKFTVRNEIRDHRQDIHHVHVSHFSHIKQIFRRLSVVEARRQAQPLVAHDPEQPLPDVTILEELDGIQQSLNALEQREDLAPHYNLLR